MNKSITILSSILLVLCLLTPAEARRYRQVQQVQQQTTWADPQILIAPTQALRSVERHTRTRWVKRTVVAPISGNGFTGSATFTLESRQSSALPHPSGCPRRAFCGCGSALEIGKSADRTLWLAAAWLKFPRAVAASGMAMVRPHHVAILKQHISGTQWLIADYNGGSGGRSLLHVRDIRGWTIVNPNG